MIPLSLLLAVDELNKWARGNGREFAYEIYDLKGKIIQRLDRAWSFRTSVIVTCRTCGGTGQFRSDECWDCHRGKTTLQFLLTEIHAGDRILQWHTPRDRARWVPAVEFEKLQIVPPGDWKPNQPGLDIERATGLALLMAAKTLAAEVLRVEVTA